MRPLALGVVVLASLGLTFVSADAEFYRWQDASGAEHFAQDLHQVPAAHRAQAKAAAEQGAAERPSAGAISYHDVPDRRPTAGARQQAREAAPPAARAPSPRECTTLKGEVRKKQKVVRTHERSVEANLRWADDITRSAFSRRKYEARAEEEARWLAKAEDDLEQFVREERQKGVEPGCLR